MKHKRGEIPGVQTGVDGIRILIVSLFIILLAFFVVLNSIAVVDERRKIEALGSLIGSFGILPGGLSPMQSEGKGISSPEAPMVTEDDFVKELLASLPSPENLSVKKSPKGRVISILDHAIFDLKNYSIKPEGFGILKRLCDMINQDEYPIRIKAHTDNRPPEEKSFASNLELSALKAQEVLRFFAVIGKVNPYRMTAYGRGELDPVASNETRESRIQNSRVDIVLDRRAKPFPGLAGQKKSSRFFVFKRFLFRMLE